MINYKNLLGSVAVATLLFTGCGDTNSNEKQKEASGTATFKPVVEKNAYSKEIASSASYTKNIQDMQRAIASNGSKNTSSRSVADTSYSLADIANSLLSNTANGSKGAVIKDAQSELYKAGVLTQKDIETIKASGVSFDELYMATFLESMTGKEVTLSSSRIFGIGTKLKEIGKKIDDKVLQPAKDVVKDKVVTPAGDAVKGAVVDLVDTSVGTELTAQVFKLMLDSGTLTNEMMKLAIKSETITEIMLNVMKKNWWLSEKMCPLLQDNQEFGELFTDLAVLRNYGFTDGTQDGTPIKESVNVPAFLFSYIDAPMYNCLGDAMIMSPNHTTKNMGDLMADLAVHYFVVPSTNDIVPEYHGQEAFPRLMFNIGDETRGDANELKNEKFFYAMFKTPASTLGFVDAMDKVKTNDEATAVAFMDFIFTGTKRIGNETDGYVTSTDTNQSYYNIIAIASSMLDGINGTANADGVLENAYGLTAYKDAFIGFAGLIPADKYMTYGTSFMNAGLFYLKQNNLEYSQAWDGILSLYDNLTSGTSSNAQAQAGGLGVIGTDWTGIIISEAISAWDNFSFDAYYNAVTDLNWTAVTSQFNNDTIVAYDNAVAKLHDEVELAIAEDLVNYDINSSALVVGQDGNTSALKLPAFGDITFDYVYTGASDFVLNYVSGIDANWLYDFSENQYVKEYLYDGASTYWEYLPSWMANLDWLKLPASLENSGYDNFDFNISAGTVDLYIVTELVDGVDTLNASMGDLVNADNNVTWVEVELNGDEPLTNDETKNYHVYKITLDVFAALNIDMDAILQSVKDAGDSVVGLFSDSSNAEVTDTNTTN